jgi:D-sedoheptulose 7-phosphate isomerase
MIKEFLSETCRLLRELDENAIQKAHDLLVDCYKENGRVYTMGNGGSASTAQHFACDLAKFVIPQDRKPFDTKCLSDNVSLFTAWANDANRDEVYTNLLKGFLGSKDVCILISVHGGSGFSTDLVQAVRYANRCGARTIALVGFDGGILHKESTCSILVPVQSTPQTEAIHLVVEHLLMDLLKKDMASVAVPIGIHS